MEQVADFLSYKLSPNTIDRITEHCTFENMKSNPMTNPDTIFKHVMSVMVAKGEFVPPTTFAAAPQKQSETSSHMKDAKTKDKVSFMRKGKGSVPKMYDKNIGPGLGPAIGILHDTPSHAG